MSVLWPNPNTGCRVDLLTATYNQIYSAVRCYWPTYNMAVSAQVATDMYEEALRLRGIISLVSGVQNAVAQVTSAASSVTRTDLSNIIQSAGSFLSGVTADVQAINRQAALNAQNTSQSLLDQVGANIGGFIGGAGNAVGGLINNATSGIGNLLSGASSAVSGIVTNVKNTVGNTINAAGAAVANLINTTKNTISGLVNDAASALGGVISFVGEGIGDFVNIAGDVIGDIATGVRGFIDGLIRNVQTGIAGIVEKLVSIPGALADLGDNIIGAVGGSVGTIVGELGKFLSDPVSGVIGGFFHGEETRALEMVNNAYDMVASNSEIPPHVKAIVADARRPGAPVPAFVAMIVLPFILGPIITQLMMPAITRAAQEEAKVIRYQLLGLSDMVQWTYRHPEDEGYLYDRAARAGFEDDDVRRARDILRPLPNPADILDWMHRGIIDEGTARTQLSMHGWMPDDVDRIVQAAPIIPPLSDMVRFVVREALPGQSAYSGQAGSSVPGSFTDLAALIGLEPDFARSYWAAHWELPSLSNVFEMYHRGIISETQLDAYLVQADVMPEWRAKVKDVAFSPLTRVDVRRMYGLGVLSAADVERSYQDLGYSQANAALLRRFTVAEEDESNRAKPDPERDLTRADIIGAYADAIITRLEASGQLRSLGYDEDETEIILDREDIRVARAARKEAKDSIVEQATARTIDMQQAGDRLAQAGLTTSEVLNTLTTIQRKLDTQTARPTKADLAKFAKLGIINPAEYHSELRALGYSKMWADRYVQLLEAGEDADTGE